MGVHLKDWTPKFGRSAERYARGFTELGTGVVPLELVLQELRRINHLGWVVVEQNNTWKTPGISALESAKWLATKQYLHKSPRKIATLETQRGDNGGLDTCLRKKCAPEDETRFIRSIMRAGTKKMGYPRKAGQLGVGQVR